MAAEGNNIVRHTYEGFLNEFVPREATHITVTARVIREGAFEGRENIVEVICDDRVRKIETEAFCGCDSLRRVIMRGVRVVEYEAFKYCKALTDVECGKLGIIKEYAFGWCESLRSIDLPYARIVERGAFDECEALTEVRFGSKLERFEERAFGWCTSLERITIPLKNGFITSDDIFQACENLKYVQLAKGDLHEAIAGLHLEEWKNDMVAAIRSINSFLPHVYAGNYSDEGGKAQVIREWIRSVRHKIIQYEQENLRMLDKVAATLQLALPRDIVMNNVLPFLSLPSRE